MGAKFVNVTVKGPEQRAIADWLQMERYRAHIGPTVENLTTVFEESIETFADIPRLRLATGLTRHFGCAALALNFYDEDVLSYELYLSGKRMDEYNSAPDYFQNRSANPSRPPQGGNALMLCNTFDRPEAVEKVRAALHDSPPSPIPATKFNTMQRTMDSIQNNVEAAYYRGPEALKQAIANSMPDLKKLMGQAREVNTIHHFGKSAADRYTELFRALQLPEYGYYLGYSENDEDLEDDTDSTRFLRTG